MHKSFLKDYRVFPPVDNGMLYIKKNNYAILLKIIIIFFNMFFIYFNYERDWRVFYYNFMNYECIKTNG